MDALTEKISPCNNVICAFGDLSSGKQLVTKFSATNREQNVSRVSRINTISYSDYPGQSTSVYFKNSNIAFIIQESMK